MKLQYITVTGADDEVHIEHLARLQEKYPLVEWGVLFSESRTGNLRYPTKQWVWELTKHKLNLSAHMCGKWCRDICGGMAPENLPIPLHAFSRIQLNFRPWTHKIIIPRLISALLPGHQYIFQSADRALVDAVSGIDAVPLFDLSGGRGELPKEWPIANGLTGYAGGLSPSNVVEQLGKISNVAGDNPIWIDVESGVRTDNHFDLVKVEQFLEVVCTHYC